MPRTSAPAALRRRQLLLGAAGALLAPASAAADPRDLTVYKTASCNCCQAWAARMAQAGFRPSIRMVEDINPVRRRFGIPFEISSCHTGVVGGYVIEGHVPPADVIRLLQEKPKALGLVVPGMPIGSPGMEIRGAKAEAFDTLLLLDRNGRTRVFARHS